MDDGEKLHNLSIIDFAELFGATEEEITRFCGDQIANLDFHYRIIEGKEKDQLILKVLKHIDSEEAVPTGRHRQPDWEKGWSENMQDFIESGYDIEKLFPKYFKKNVPVRLNRNYVMPIHEDFVLNVTKLFRSWLYQKYFQEVENIYEFGCGSASNLAYLASIYPQKKLHGFDWTRASQEIIRSLAQHYDWPIKGNFFDLFCPDENIQIEPNSAVFTFAALEQLGNNCECFFNFILRKSPELCVNVEGLSELYEQDYLPDYLALKYHKRRNYLDGFLTRLRELEEEAEIEIIKVHHQQFGNLFDDSHSYIVWKPKK